MWFGITLSLNPRFLFENFIQGSANKMAYFSALKAAREPGKINPLYICGSVGLGKTHLLNAIGNFVVQNRMQSTRIILTTAELFLNEFINALQQPNNQNAMNEFRRKYREYCDMLLIDDIAFFAKKLSSQEEFFHTFDWLLRTGKQITITSDRPPENLEDFDDRLKSRFGGMGVAVKIDPPDFETRVAIIKIKSKEQNVEVPDEVAYFIAERIINNVRELEGALNWVIIKSQMENKPITKEFAQEALLVRYSVREDVNFDKILEKTSSFFGLRPQDVKSPRKPKKIVTARQVAMYLCREILGMSLKDIGDRFGGKDHTTVIHAMRKIQEEMSQSAEIRSIVTSIRENIIRNSS